MNYGTETKVVAFQLVDHGFNLPAICEFNAGSSGVSKGLLQQIASYLLRFSQDDLLESIDILESASVYDFRAGIDMGSFNESAFFAQGSVAFPPTANDVVALEGESRRVEAAY